MTVSSLALFSCGQDKDDFYFKGRIVAGNHCGYEITYLIEMELPKTGGDTITIDGRHVENAIVAHRAPVMHKIGDVVYGVARPVTDYAATHCGRIFYDRMPEMLLISTEEDSVLVTNHYSK